jgi:hypothetical protein
MAVGREQRHLEAVARVVDLHLGVEVAGGIGAELVKPPPPGPAEVAVEAAAHQLT